VKILFFRFNLDKIAPLNPYVEANLRSKAKVQYRLKIVSLTFALILCLLPLFSIAELFYGLLQVRLGFWNFLSDVISTVVYNLSAILTDLIEEIIGAFFLVCSILICAMYEQFSEELQELNKCKDKEQLKRTLKSLVLLHAENTSYVKNIINSYQTILNLSFLTAIVNLTNSLLYMDIENLGFLLLTTPLVFFDLWVYCFSCEMMKTSV
jgi:hypothetical protein